MKILLKKLSSKLSTLHSQFSINKAFTLIELLVVIAVLGVLATIVLLAVNPGEQLARARDTSRVAAVTQIGRSLLSYYTAQGAKYPLQASPPFTQLTNSQDLKTIPTNPSATLTTTWGNCTVVTGPHAPATQQVNESGWCYVVNNAVAANVTEAIVFTGLESQQNDAKCATTTNFVWWVFSTAQGRGGFTCTATVTTAPVVNLLPADFVQ